MRYGFFDNAEYKLCMINTQMRNSVGTGLNISLSRRALRPDRKRIYFFGFKKKDEHKVISFDIYVYDDAQCTPHPQSDRNCFDFVDTAWAT